MGKGRSDTAREGLELNAPQVSFKAPSPEAGFNLTERDGYTLIVPTKRKHEWKAEERVFRSLIIDSEGKVVSSGFPKFGNWGEPGYEREVIELETALSLGEKVWWSEKLDGSLGIRSVIDGKVVFRTRGSFDGGDFGKAMRKVAEAKYPQLLDPNFEKDGSLLFEFISPSPEFRIVIRYPEADLVLIGKVSHQDLKLADLEELEELAQANQLRLVETLEMPHDPEQLFTMVGEWENREGVVVRFAEGQKLLKVKSLNYLALHRLRSHLTAKNIREQCEANQVRSLEDFKKIIYDLGGDWEMVEDAKPYVVTYIETSKQAETEYHKLVEKVEKAIESYPERKAFALEFAQRLPTSERSIAFLLLDGKKDQALAKVRHYLLDEAFKDHDKEDELKAELFES